MKKLTDQHKNKISKARTGKKQTDHQKRVASQTHRRKVVSPQTKDKISRAAKQREYPVVTCPVCGFVGHAPVIYRWHFERCKFYK